MLVAGVVIACIAAGVFVVLQPAGPAGAPSGTLVPVTVGVYPEIINTPLYIAEDRGLFREYGLEVSIKPYDSGMTAAEAMVRGEIEFAAMSEYAFTGEVFQDPGIVVIAGQDKSQRFYVFSQEGRGVANIPDLNGKRIGIARRTAAEFYLGRFLVLHDIGFWNVTIVDTRPRDTVEAFSAGKIDAFIAELTAAEELQSLQDGSVIAWPAQGGQPSYNLVTGRKDWVIGHPEPTIRFLRSLDAASEYATTHPEDAKRIVKERLNLTDTYINAVWPDHHFSLTLDQSLVLAMEDEARWMIANNLTNGTEIPDFREYIYTDGLNTVKPGSVHIIG
jgi:NitT/TauT family transport system substrate-binding protein